MFLQRSAVFAARRAVRSTVVKRSFTSSFVRRDVGATPATGPNADKKMKVFEEIKTEADLLPPGAAIGAVPTDLDQATGLERLEILGKMNGVDIFDMAPLDASRRGTLEDPILVKSYGDEQFAGCTGSPADSHVTIWLGMSKDRPIERCPECGSVYKMDYIGPQEDPHAHGHDAHGHDAHHHHGYEEPKTFADFIKPEYR